jgi:hypothetical protein
MIHQHHVKRNLNVSYTRYTINWGKIIIYFSAISMPEAVNTKEPVEQTQNDDGY